MYNSICIIELCLIKMVDITLIVLIVVFVTMIVVIMMSSDRIIDKYQLKFRIISNFSIIITLMIFIFTYLGNERDRAINEEVAVKKSIFDSMISIETLFSGRRDLDSLYLDIKGIKPISDEELNNMDVKHTIAILLTSIDSFINSDTKDYGTDLYNRINSLLKSKSLNTYFYQHKEDFSPKLDKYFSENIIS